MDVKQIISTLKTDDSGKNVIFAIPRRHTPLLITNVYGQYAAWKRQVLSMYGTALVGNQYKRVGYTVLWAPNGL